MSEVTKLPAPDTAWVEEQKIREYLLNRDHPQGGPKAKFFMNRGFSLENWEVMRNALVRQGVSNLVVKIVDNQYGKRYTVECSCPTPDETHPCIRSVWEVRVEDNRPRLITAHPLKV